MMLDEQIGERLVGELLEGGKPVTREQLQRMKRLLVEGDELAANASRLFHGSIAPPRRGRGVIMPG